MIFFGLGKAISAVANRFPGADWILSNHSRFSGYDSSPPDNSRRFNPFESHSVWKHLSYPFLSPTGAQKNPLRSAGLALRSAGLAF
jgi:hypothetical protein